MCAALGLAAILAAPAVARDILVGGASATDRDSLVIAEHRVRLHASDAFEGEQICTRANGRTQACSGEAPHELAKLVACATIVCVRRDADAYVWRQLWSAAAQR